jgi:hypothetical protein
VEKTLNAIEGVEAIVSVRAPVATITMDKHIPTTQLVRALSRRNYSIEMSKPVAAAEKLQRSRLRNLAAVLQKINKTKTVINIIKSRHIREYGRKYIVPCIVKGKYMKLGLSRLRNAFGKST